MLNSHFKVVRSSTGKRDLKDVLSSNDGQSLKTSTDMLKASKATRASLPVTPMAETILDDTHKQKRRSAQVKTAARSTTKSRSSVTGAKSGNNRLINEYFKTKKAPAYARFKDVLQMDTPFTPHHVKGSSCVDLIKLADAVEKVMNFSKARGLNGIIFHGAQKAIETIYGGGICVSDLDQLLEIALKGNWLLCEGCLWKNESGHFVPSVKLLKPSEQESFDHEKRLTIFKELYEAHISTKDKDQPESPLVEVKHALKDSDTNGFASKLIQSSKEGREIRKKDDIKKVTSLYKVSALSSGETKKESIEDLKAKGLSLMERIRLREERRKAQQESVGVDSAERLALSRLPRIVNTVEMAFKNYDKKTYYLRDMVKKVITSMGALNCHMSEKECTESLYKLHSLYPQWLIIEKTEFGTLMKLGSSLTRNDVVKSLEDKLSKSSSA